MKLKIQLPEIFILCSTVLFVSDASVEAWVFFSLGVLGAIFRLGLQMQEQQQQATAVKEGVDVLKGAADEFLGSLNEAVSGRRPKSKRSNLN